MVLKSWDLQNSRPEGIHRMGSSGEAGRQCQRDSFILEVTSVYPKLTPITGKGADFAGTVLLEAQISEQQLLRGLAPSSLAGSSQICLGSKLSKTLTPAIQMIGSVISSARGHQKIKSMLHFTASPTTEQEPRSRYHSSSCIIHGVLVPGPVSKFMV